MVVKLADFLVEFLVLFWGLGGLLVEKLGGLFVGWGAEGFFYCFQVGLLGSPVGGQPFGVSLLVGIRGVYLPISVCTGDSFGIQYRFRFLLGIQLDHLGLQVLEIAFQRRQYIALHQLDLAIFIDVQSFPFVGLIGCWFPGESALVRAAVLFPCLAGFRVFVLVVWSGEFFWVKSAHNKIMLQ